MKLTLFMPYGCDLEGAWEDAFKGWAEEHGLPVEVYHDKTETWDRIAALTPGSIFVGELWDFNLHAEWTPIRIVEALTRLAKTVPEQVGVMLFDTFAIVPAPPEIRKMLQPTYGDRVQVVNSAHQNVMEIMDAIFACLQTSHQPQ